MKFYNNSKALISLLDSKIFQALYNSSVKYTAVFSPDFLREADLTPAAGPL